MALSATLRTLSITLVFGNIRTNASIPQHLACLFGVKCTVSVKEGVVIDKPELVKLPEDVFQPRSEVVTVIVITSNDLTRGKNKAVCVS